MQGNLAGYNANEFEPNVGFLPIPPGQYMAIIQKSEMQPTKARDGEFLFLELQIVEGPHQGRLLFDRLNLVNRNATAVEIAKRTLSAICRAVGRMTPQDSKELHNIPLVVSVAIEKRKDTGENSNVVKGYQAAGDAPPVASPAPAETPVRSPAPAGSGGKPGAPPWARGR